MKFVRVISAGRIKFTLTHSVSTGFVSTFNIIEERNKFNIHVCIIVLKFLTNYITKYVAKLHRDSTAIDTALKFLYLPAAYLRVYSLSTNLQVSSSYPLKHVLFQLGAYHL